jgi:hypothetical protein
VPPPIDSKLNIKLKKVLDSAPFFFTEIYHKRPEPLKYDQPGLNSVLNLPGFHSSVSVENKQGYSSSYNL